LRKSLVKRNQHDKGYSGEDICLPQMKELHEGGFPYYKTESPWMKHERIDGGMPWEMNS
jgi:hypothetical protein